MIYEQCTDIIDHNRKHVVDLALGPTFADNVPLCMRFNECTHLPSQKKRLLEDKGVMFHNSLLTGHLFDARITYRFKPAGSMLSIWGASTESWKILIKYLHHISLSTEEKAWIKSSTNPLFDVELPPPVNHGATWITPSAPPVVPIEEFSDSNSKVESDENDEPFGRRSRPLAIRRRTKSDSDDSDSENDSDGYQTPNAASYDQHSESSSSDDSDSEAGSASDEEEEDNSFPFVPQDFHKSGSNTRWPQSRFLSSARTQPRPTSTPPFIEVDEYSTDGYESDDSPEGSISSGTTIQPHWEDRLEMRLNERYCFPDNQEDDPDYSDTGMTIRGVNDEEDNSPPPILIADERQSIHWTFFWKPVVIRIPSLETDYRHPDIRMRMFSDPWFGNKPPDIHWEVIESQKVLLPVSRSGRYESSILFPVINFETVHSTIRTPVEFEESILIFSSFVWLLTSTDLSCLMKSTAFCRGGSNPNGTMRSDEITFGSIEPIKVGPIVAVSIDRRQSYSTALVV